MSTTATNGYMIRLELLKMAKEMLEQDWHAHRDLAHNTWDRQIEMIKFRADGAGSAVGELPPAPTLRPFPTEAEVITKATALNQFINTK